MTEAEAEVEACCSMVDLKKERACVRDYESEVAQESFWDDPASAQKVMAVLDTHRATLERVDRWAAWVDDISAALDMSDDDESSSIGCEDNTNLLFEGPSEMSEELLCEARSVLSLLCNDLEAFKVEGLMSGPYDQSGARLTVTAGAGGTDAQDWAQMLQRMYEKWAERKEGLKCQCLEMSEGDEAGIRSAELKIEGANAYGLLAGEKVCVRLRLLAKGRRGGG